MPYTFDKDDFITKFPEFSNTLETLFEFQLKFAQKIVSSYVPKYENCDTFKLATYYVLAYLLSLGKNPYISVGVASSASEGSVSISMSIPKMAETWWGKNYYGITALLILRPFARGAHLIYGKLESDIVDV